jgi:hypothetical protein
MSSEPLPRWSVATVAGLCVVALAYTLYRGAVVSLEYFDGFQFLVTARKLAGGLPQGGFNLVRPPLIALLDVPALWIAGHGGPANLAYTRGPHLTAALLSLLSAFAVYYALRASLETPFALLGVALFVTGRLFVRYGSLTMADIVSMAGGALAVGLHVRSIERPRWAHDILCGVSIGVAASAKYPLLLMGGVVVMTEVLVALSRRRLPLRRILALGTTGVVAALSFVGVLSLAYGLGLGWSAVKHLPGILGDTLKQAGSLVYARPGESRWDNASMIAAVTAWPILALAVLGLVLAAKERQPRDYPFAAWLVCVGGVLIATIGHNEVRYLVPIFPALIYFAVRGVEWLLRRAPSPRVAGTAVAVLALGCSWGGVRQALADADPVFRADTERKAAVALARARRPGGRLRWIGPFSCLYPVSRVPLVYDEFFDAFNFYGPSMIYFLGEPAEVIPSFLAAGDGDAVVVAGPNCNGAALPDRPPAPWSVYGVARRPLTRLGDQLATADGALVLRLVSRPGGLALTVMRGPSAAPSVERQLFVSVPGPRLTGPLPLTSGSEIPLYTHDASDVRLELLELRREIIAAPNDQRW